MKVATIPVSLSQDSRHVVYITCRWSYAADTGITMVDLPDFEAEFTQYCRLACGKYDERAGVWQAADGFRIDRLTAEDRAMAAAMAYAQRNNLQTV